MTSTLFTDDTLVMDETTAEHPLGWTPPITAHPAPVGRVGQAGGGRARPGRWWAHLLVWGGGTSVAAAALAYAWPTAGPVVTTLSTGLLP